MAGDGCLFHNYAPDIDWFFDALCDKPKWKMTCEEEIFHNRILLQAFCMELLGNTNEEYQVRLLERFTALVKKYYQNAAICMHYKIHYFVLWFLSKHCWDSSNGLETFSDSICSSTSSSSLPFLSIISSTIPSDIPLSSFPITKNSQKVTYLVCKKMLNLFLNILKLSVSSIDLYHLFQVFHLKRAVCETNPLAHRVMQLYLTTLEILSRRKEGPATFFYLLGRHTSQEETSSPFAGANPNVSINSKTYTHPVKSGILLPETIVFPSSIYTFICWIRMENSSISPSPSLSSLFSFRGSTGVGVAASMEDNDMNLEVYTLDNMKSLKSQKVILRDALQYNKWCCVALTHTHRQLRNSKLDVYINGNIKFAGKFSYPTISEMSPLSFASIGVPSPFPSERPVDYFRGQIGSFALFQCTLSSKIVEEISSDVTHFEKYICTMTYLPKNMKDNAMSGAVNPNISISNNSSSIPFSLSQIGQAGYGYGSGNGNTVFAYDARNVDLSRGILYDSSVNLHHARIAEPSRTFILTTSYLKEQIWKIGGVILWLPIFAPSVSSCWNERIKQELNPAELAQSINVIAELFRLSPINKFLWKRLNGIRLLSHILCSLTSEYLTENLFETIFTLSGAVSSDIALRDQIQIHLIYHFDIWSNASYSVQKVVLKSFEEAIENMTLPSSIFPSRLLRRALYDTYGLRRSFSHISIDEHTELRNTLFELLDMSLRIQLVEESHPVKEEQKPKLKSKERSLSLLSSSSSSSSSSIAYSSTYLKEIICCSCGIPYVYRKVQETEQLPIEEICPFLSFFTSLLTKATDPILQILTSYNGIHIFLFLLKKDSRQIQLKALQWMRLYLTLKVQKEGSDSLCSFDKTEGFTYSFSLESFQLYSPTSSQSPLPSNSFNDPFMLAQYKLLGNHLKYLGEIETNVAKELFNHCVVLNDPILPREITTVIDLQQAKMNDSGLLQDVLQAVETQGLLPVKVLTIVYMKALFCSNTYVMQNNATLRNFDLWLIRLLNIGCITEAKLKEYQKEAMRYFDGLDVPVLLVDSLNLKDQKNISCFCLEDTEPSIQMLTTLKTVCKCLDKGSEKNKETLANVVREYVSILKKRLQQYLSLPSTPPPPPPTPTSNPPLTPPTSPLPTPTPSSSDSTLTPSLLQPMLYALVLLDPVELVQMISDETFKFLSNLLKWNFQHMENSWIVLMDFIEASSLLHIPYNCPLHQNIENQQYTNEWIQTEITVKNGRVQIHSSRQMVYLFLTKLIETLHQDLCIDEIKRESILWHNLIEFASITSALVLHYDTTADMDSSNIVLPFSCSSFSCGSLSPSPSTIPLPPSLQNLTFNLWCSPSFCPFEFTTIDRLVNLLSLFLPHLNCDVDIDFSITSRSTLLALTLNDCASKSLAGTSQSTFSSRYLNRPNASPISHSNTMENIRSMKGFPGGVIRQILSLQLRLLFMQTCISFRGFKTNTADSSFSSFPPSLTAALSSSFQRFIHIMKELKLTSEIFTELDRNLFFSPLSQPYSGLILKSDEIKTMKGVGTSIVLWLAVELFQLYIVMKESAFHTGLPNEIPADVLSYLQTLLTSSMDSEKDIQTCLGSTDFVENYNEIRRRDQFLQEQIELSKENRMKRMKKEEEQKRELDKVADERKEEISNKTIMQEKETNYKENYFSQNKWQMLKVAEKVQMRRTLMLTLQRIKELSFVWQRKRDDSNGDDLTTGVASYVKLQQQQTHLHCTKLCTDRFILDEYISNASIRKRILRVCNLGEENETLVELLKGIDLFDDPKLLHIKQKTSSSGSDNVHLSEKNDQTENTGGKNSESMYIEEQSARQEKEGVEDEDEGEKGGEQREGIEEGKRTEEEEAEDTVETLSLCHSEERDIERGDTQRETERERNTQNEATQKKETTSDSVSLPLSLPISISKSLSLSRSESDSKGSTPKSLADRFATRIQRMRQLNTSRSIEMKNDLMKKVSETKEALQTTDAASRRFKSMTSALRRAQSSVSNAAGTSIGAGNFTGTSASTVNREETTQKGLQVPTNLIFPEIIINGTLVHRQNAFIFEGQSLSNHFNDRKVIPTESSLYYLKKRVWGIRIISAVYRRTIHFTKYGLEFFFVDGANCLLAFDTKEVMDEIVRILKNSKPLCLSEYYLCSPSKLIKGLSIVDDWRRRQISNFDYLMYLNNVAGRSYNTLHQYPIMPWVIADYTSESLDLSNPKTYRDFGQNILCQTREGLEHFRLGESPSSPSNESSTHCPNPSQCSSPQIAHLNKYVSTADTVLSLLGFLSPYCDILSFRHISPVKNIALAYQQACDAFQKQPFELIPEYYYLPDLFYRTRTEAITLPPWAKTPEQFVLLNRLALESEYVSQHLHQWIDLIFGIKQAGEEAVKAHNQANYLCYGATLDFATLPDPNSTKYLVASYGQVPNQLFRALHPLRLDLDSTLRQKYPSMHLIASLSSSQHIRRLEIRTIHAVGVATVCFVPQQAFVYSIDENRVVQMYKYFPNKVTNKSFPSTVDPLEMSWQMPQGRTPRLVTIFYDYLVSAGCWDGSWEISWSNDGEIVQRVHLHQRITCMTSSYDSITGDMALALGSEDGTISIWALARSKAIKAHKKRHAKDEMPVGSLPWVLLTGQGTPVTCIAMNVALDVVVSGSQTQVIIYSLRQATVQHIVSLSSHKNTAFVSIAISSYGDIIAHTIQQGSSSLHLVSMNGVHVHSYCIAEEIKEATRLLPSLCFSSCGSFFITATAGRYGGIDVRSTCSLRVERRVESKPACHITCFTVSKDERCLLAGYQDGSIIAYGLHYGIFTACIPFQTPNKMIGDDSMTLKGVGTFSNANSSPNQSEANNNPNPNQAETKDRSEIISLVQLHFSKASRSSPCDFKIEYLNVWHTLLRTQCNEKESKYETYITEIYNLLCPNVAHKGIKLGFQRDNPVTDFRAGGMLSLRCLVYFAEHYTSQANRMMNDNIPGSRPNTYPFGPAAINITCMLTSMLWNSEGEINETVPHLFTLIKGEDFLYQLFSITFAFFDTLWYASFAHYGLFAVILEETKIKLLNNLEKSPKSLNELNYLLNSPLNIQVNLPSPSSNIPFTDQKVPKLIDLPSFLSPKTSCFMESSTTISTSEAVASHDSMELTSVFALAHSSASASAAELTPAPAIAHPMPVSAPVSASTPPVFDPTPIPASVVYETSSTSAPPSAPVSITNDPFAVLLKTENNDQPLDYNYATLPTGLEEFDPLKKKEN